MIRKENNCNYIKVKKTVESNDIQSKDTRLYDAPRNYNIFRAIKQTFIEKMYHTIHTLDVFNLYLSIPNLSIALEKPKTLDETQLCF